MDAGGDLPRGIIRRSQAIFCRLTHIREEIGVQSPRKLCGWGRRERQNRHFREVRFHLGLFIGVIIQKDDTIYPEIQLLARRNEIACLGSPIHTHRGKMRCP